VNKIAAFSKNFTIERVVVMFKGKKCINKGFKNHLLLIYCVSLYHIFP